MQRIIICKAKLDQKEQNSDLVSKNNNLGHVIGPARADEPQVARAPSVGEKDHLGDFLGATIRHKKPPRTERN